MSYKVLVPLAEPAMGVDILEFVTPDMAHYKAREASLKTPHVVVVTYKPPKGDAPVLGRYKSGMRVDNIREGIERSGEFSVKLVKDTGPLL